jgi:O-antigen ligase
LTIFVKNWGLIGSASIGTARRVKSLEQNPSWGRRIIMAVSGTILIFASLAYGAVVPWAYFPIGLVTATASLALLASLLYRIYAWPHEALLIPYPPLWWLAAGLIILLIIQVFPWPQGLVAHLSPQAWKIRALGNGFGLANSLPFSLNPYATWLAGLKLWPAVVLFFMLIYVLDSRRKLQGMVGLILGVGLLETFYGFLHLGSHYRAYRLCGTFVNSNHLATLLTMSILLGFGLFLGMKETAPHLTDNSSKWEMVRHWARSENMEPQLRRLLLLFLLLLLAVGLIFTGSRGGMVSLVMGFGLIALFNWSQNWRRGHIFIMVLFLVAAILYSLVFGSQPTLDQFSDTNSYGRLEAYKGALAIFKEFPLIGSGIATFGDLFYRFQPAYLKNYYFDYTHNDWLQLLAETGMVGFFMVGAAWMTFFSIVARQLSRRRQGFARGLALGGIAALSAGTFHAIVDFPFHIPADALVFSSIAALTYSAAYHHNHGVEFFSYRTLKLADNCRSAAVLIILAVMAVQLTFGVRVCYYWLGERAAPTKIDSTHTAPKSAGLDFRRALTYSPTNSKYYLGLAETMEDMALEGGKDSEAEKFFKSAIFYSPANWEYRFKSAEFFLKHCKDAPDHYIPLALRELAAAVALFPESGPLHFRLASILAWTQKYNPSLIPSALENSQAFHLSEAIRLEPKLKKYLNSCQGQSPNVAVGFH